MDTFLIILHVILCFTALPLSMKSWDRVFKVVAIGISLFSTPIAMVLGPGAAFIGYACVWIFNKVVGIPFQ